MSRVWVNGAIAALALAIIDDFACAVLVFDNLQHVPRFRHAFEAHDLDGFRGAGFLNHLFITGHTLVMDGGALAQ